MSQASEILDILLPEQIIHQLAQETKAARVALVQSTTAQINDILSSLAEELREGTPAIIIANQIDLDKAKQSGSSSEQLNLLALDQDRIEKMVQNVTMVHDSADPIAQTLSTKQNKDGSQTEYVSTPIGVIGVIYETSPNTITDAAALCLKSRNSLILCGDITLTETSKAIHKVIQDTLRLHNIAKECISMIPTTDSDIIDAMLLTSQYIDVLIPRGSSALNTRVIDGASMPVFASTSGPCHIYIHSSANASTARKVILDSKPSSGSVDTLLIDKDTDRNLAKKIIQDLINAGYDIVGDKMAQGIHQGVAQATQDDWGTQHLRKKLSCAIVSNINEAVSHINGYGAHHTDCILAEDKAAVESFTRNVDSAQIMHNCFTELSHSIDLGVTTGKLHARGPIGLEQLCSYKYITRSK